MSQDINKTKFELISSLQSLKYSETYGKPFGLLAHSILNSINLFELIKIYVNGYDSEKWIRSGNWIQNNILKRVVDSRDNLQIYTYVFEALKQETYLNRLRFRMILEAVITTLPEEYKFEYFTYFFFSRYTYERRSALAISEQIWSSKLQQYLIKDFENTLDFDVLWILVPKVNNKELLELFKIAWKYDRSSFMKAKFYKRLKKCRLADLQFVKDSDPGYYLSLISEADGKKISAGLLSECFESIPDSRTHFGIWVD